MTKKILSYLVLIFLVNGQLLSREFKNKTNSCHEDDNNYKSRGWKKDTISHNNIAAYQLIEKIIQTKDEGNLKKNHSFSCKSYHKIIFSRPTKKHPPFDLESNTDKLPRTQDLFTMESIKEIRHSNPDKYNEKILSSNITGDPDPIISLITSQIEAFSFDNKYLSLLDKKFANPLHKENITLYNFFIKDTLYTKQTDSIYIISFYPEKDNLYGLKGSFRVNKKSYTIQNIIAKSPVNEQRISLKIQQAYKWVNKRQYFPQKRTTDITFKKHQGLAVKSIQTFADLKINPSFQQDKPAVEIQNLPQHANNKDTSKAQIIPLTEQKIHKVVDSLKKQRQIKKLEIISNGIVPLNYFDLPLNKIIDYNNKEGLRLGFGIITNERISSIFSVGGYFGYGFADETWKYGGDLILNLHQPSESKLRFSYFNDVKETGGYYFLESIDFSSSAFYRKFMIQEMDLEEKLEVSYSFTSLKHLKTNLFFNQSFITNNYSFSNNDIITTATNEYGFNEIGIQFRYAFNGQLKHTIKNNNLYGYQYPVLYANITKGSQWLRGEFNYIKYEAKISQSIKTQILGHSRITLVGGIMEGKTPVTKLYNGHGSYQPFSLEVNNSFRTMRMNEFYASRFFSVFFKHDFRHHLFKNQLSKPKISIVNNIGFGLLESEKDRYSIPVKSFKKGYYECGLLINTILHHSFIGYGFGVFYRYGPYAFEKTAKNFAYKLSLTIGL